MSRLMLVALLAACGRITTSAITGDGAIDVWQPILDARVDAVRDAYVPRPCDAPASFADGLVPSRILHVAPGALHGDGSAGAPFGSIAAAAAVATPGTFIKLASGEHATNQFVPDLRGTAQAPIWIGGAPGTYPLIRGGSEALHLTRPAYVVVQNLELRDQTGNGINIDDGVGDGDAHHVALNDLYVHRVDSTGTNACVREAGVDNLYVSGSGLNRCSVGIDLIGVHGAVVARNLLHGSMIAAVQVRGGSSDVDIRQNKIGDANSAGISLGGTTPLSLFRPPLSTTTPNAEARRVRAFNNIITGSTWLPFAFVGCVDCLIAHNLTYVRPAALIRILQGTESQAGYVFEPTSYGRVINNSFVWMQALSSPHVEVAPFASASTFTFSNNLWWSTTQSSSTPILPVTETGSVIGVSTGYHESSPTVYCDGPEKGAALPLPEVDGTFEGYCRASGDAPTIGPQMAVLAACDL
jgi:hypothetical protein